MTNHYIIFLLTIFSTFLFVIFMIYIIRYLLNKPFNLTLNPPKAHPFVEKQFKSAIDDIIGIAAISPFIYSLVLSSARLFTIAIYFSMIPIRQLLIPFLILQLEFILQNTLDLFTDALPYLDNNYHDHALLRQVHEYLTPYIRSYDTIFHFIGRVIRYLEEVDSPHLGLVVNLEEQYTDAGHRLVDLYREIERVLAIDIDDSPISVQE